MSANAAPIRAFLSYARADDREFGFVAPLVSKLKALVKAKSGRTLEVFVDRDSIGWGEDWRDRLSESVEGATIFLPLLSATYLDRDACREEFLAFHSKADVLGVTELLLPILLFHSPLFSPESSDEIVQLAERRQYKCLEDGVLAGYESSTWLTTLNDLANSLIAALDKAEAVLEASAQDQGVLAVGDLSVAEGETVEETVLDDGDDQLGLAELVFAMNEAIDEMNLAASPLGPAIEALGAAAKQHELPESPTPAQFKIWSLNASRAFVEPSAAIEKHGKDLYHATKSLDAVIEGMRTLMSQVRTDEYRQPIEDGLRGVVENFGDLSEVEISMEGLLNSLEPAEIMSVPLRKALRPARRGLTSIRDSLRMIRSWRLDQRSDE